MNTLKYEQEVFDRLRKRYHLSFEDGEIYNDVDRNFEVYRERFEEIGLTLKQHQGGAIYMQREGDERLGKKGQRMGVFMLVLVEHLGESRSEVVSSLLSDTFEASDLPHLQTPRYREYMAMDGVEITTEDGLKKLMRNFARHGFGTMIGDDAIQFQRPVLRFVDLIQEAAGLDDEGVENSE